MFLGKRERRTTDRQTRNEGPNSGPRKIKGAVETLDPPALILDTTRPKGNARTGIRAVAHHHSSWTKKLGERLCKNPDNSLTLAGPTSHRATSNWTVPWLPGRVYRAPRSTSSKCARLARAGA
jgi:hypothetical protein